MSRVRGKKRMEIIKKFLEGEEDPKYEVVPTVTEGKYFVRPRKTRSKKEKKGQGAELNEYQISEEEEEVEESKQKQQKQKQQKLKPEQEQQKHEPELKQKQKKIHFDSGFDPTISYQILEQLKLLGEEQRLKREKKEQKKLVKHQIRKQLKKKEPEPESSEEYDYEVAEEEPKLLFKPTPLRRRVNLVK